MSPEGFIVGIESSENSQNVMKRREKDDIFVTSRSKYFES